MKFNNWMELMCFLCWTALVLTLTFSCAKMPVDQKEIPETVKEVMNPPTKKELFTTKSKLPWLIILTLTASCVLQSPELLDELGSVDKFTHTTMTTDQVKAAVINFKPSQVATYKTKNPFSAVIATTYKTDKTTLYLNSRKNPREISEMVATLCHESSHLNGFSHGDNNPKGKDKSVPYYLGAHCKRLTALCLPKDQL